MGSGTFRILRLWPIAVRRIDGRMILIPAVVAPRFDQLIVGDSLLARTHELALIVLMLRIIDLVKDILKGDVGVAGLCRLMSRQSQFVDAKAVVVVAGMDGALCSVAGGMTAAPVIAVPTSVGYGASFGGISALLAMLNICAAGVSVVNIDNGFGGGYMAAVINAQSV